MPGAMDNTRQRIELADIFTSHAETFLQTHKLCSEQQMTIPDYTLPLIPE